MSDLKREVFMQNIETIEPVNKQPDEISTSSLLIGANVQMIIKFALDQSYDAGNTLKLTFDDN